jgi:hypothetical protein
MLRRTFCASAVLAAASTLTACAVPAARAHVPQPLPTSASGRVAEVQIIDRTTGQMLPIHHHGGKRYVAGTPGNRYALVVRNRTNARVLTIVSVDGVNAVSGETAAWDQNGYVFAPWQRWEIRGWRKSQERIAAFEFTALPNSYAARTGRPEHVGVIGVAVFRERLRPQPQPAPQVLRSEEAQEAPAPGAAGAGADSATGSSASAPARAAAEPGPAPSPSSEAIARQRDSAKLGTGHGRSESSWVSFTEFERARRTPDEIITIHYDSRENLIALGVIMPPGVPGPNPFPGNVGFVPDPPR